MFLPKMVKWTDLRLDNFFSTFTKCFSDMLEFLAYVLINSYLKVIFCGEINEINIFLIRARYFLNKV